MSETIENGPLKLPGRRQYLLVAALFITLSIAATVAIPFIKNPFEDFNYYGMPIERSAPEFSLQNIQGNQVQLSDYQGRFVYLMFGYLGCDEVCHSQTLAFHTLNQNLHYNEVHFLYLGMDPDNDTPERIAGYFDSRAGNFDGLIAADVKHAQQVAARYHAFFSIQPEEHNATRKIFHPGYIYLIDPDGKLRMIYSGNHLDTGKMLLDLRHIQTEFG
jgi:protein SCO1/2